MKNLVMDLKKSLLAFTALFIGSMLLSQPATAKEHVLDGTQTQCKATLKVKGSNNCDGSQCNKVDCLCAETGDKIIWNVPGKKNFRISFINDSPFKGKCGEKFKKGKQQCKIEQAFASGKIFDYDIELEGCAEGVDPRIVIK